MDGIGNGLGMVFAVLAILCLLIGGCMTGVIGYWTTSDDIRSTSKIEPSYELMVDDSNNVDTVWIYEKQ